MRRAGLKRRPRRVVHSDTEGMVQVLVLNDAGVWEFDKLVPDPKLKPPKRKPISPASRAQRAAVGDQTCLGCGREGAEWLAIDPAHVVPRGRGGCDSELCVVPLCRTFAGDGCHRLYDEGKLDLLRVVAEPAGWERWRPHVQHALEHCGLVELVERLAGARTQWTEDA